MLYALHVVVVVFIYFFFIVTGGRSRDVLRHVRCGVFGVTVFYRLRMVVFKGISCRVTGVINLRVG